MATRWILLSIATLLVLTSANINWGGSHYRTVLQSDSWGYHAYLPALLLNGDLHFSAADSIERKLYFDPARFYEYRVVHDGGIINKYYIGTAVMQLPLFLAAHAYALASGELADGWSKPYVVAVNLSAIAFVLLGLWCLQRVLRTYGVSDALTAFTIATFMLGTNLFYYTVAAPGMSHAYSFGLCCALLLTVRCFARSPQPGQVLWIGALLGAMVLVRPVNGLILLALPILFDDRQALRRGLGLLLRSPQAIAGGALLFLIALVPQLLYYRLATGHWIVDSYAREGFHWSEPHMLEILLSYRKGLFVYTPLTLLSIVGVYHFWRRSRLGAFTWLIFLVILTYVLSSWWSWWYGGSFGSRVYIEYLPLFALPFALAATDLARPWRKAYLSIAILLVVLCQAQTYQARYGLIPLDHMNGERYWSEFMRIDRIP